MFTDTSPRKDFLRVSQRNMRTAVVVVSHFSESLRNKVDQGEEATGNKVGCCYVNRRK